MKGKKNKEEDEIKQEIKKIFELTKLEFCKENPQQIIFNNDKKNEEVNPSRKEDENKKNKDKKNEDIKRNNNGKI